MQTRSLETLVRISQVRSFSRAAQLQNMTLAALSMQMKALEAELGVNLFDRTFRPPRLTSLGREIAGKAKDVINAQKQLSDLCSSGDELTGSFQIGFIQSASVRFLPKFLMLAKLKAPNAQFQYSSGLSEVLTERVELGQIDAAVITRVDGMSRNLNSDLIVSEEMAIALPAAHANLTPKSLRTTLPFIHFMPSTGVGKLIAAAFENLTSAPEKTLVLDSIEACVECVKAGLGYTILPLPDIQRYSDKSVCVLENALVALRRDIVLITRKEPRENSWRPGVHSLLSQTIA